MNHLQIPWRQMQQKQNYQWRSEKSYHTPLWKVKVGIRMKKRCVQLHQTGTQEEKAKEEELKKRKVQDDASGRKSYLKTLYTMHLYANIKCKIWNKLINMLIYISI